MTERTAQAFFLILSALLLSGTGELFLKRGINQIGVIDLNLTRIIPQLIFAFAQPFIILGFTLIFSGAILWLLAISRVELSWAYPMLSIGYIYVLVISRLFLGETITPLKVVGILVIISGVYILFRSP